MKTIELFSRYATGFGVAAAMLAGGCSVMEPRADSWATPGVGSTWEVAQRNTGSYGKDAQFRVSRGDGTWQGMQVIALASSLGMTTLASIDDGRRHAIVGRDGKPVLSWDPPIGWQYPLTVGKKWTMSPRMTIHAKGKVLPYELACEAASFGDVDVPAGTFKAFKIVCSTTIGNEETFWFSPELGISVKTSLRRTDKSPFGAGTQEAELVSHAIRR